MIIEGGLKSVTPVKQALFGLALGLVGMTIAHFAVKGEGYEFIAAFIGLLMFIVINAFASITGEGFIKYTLPSFGIYIVLLAALMFLARLISGTSIFEYYPYQMMVVAFSGFYIIATIIARLIKALYEFSNEDN
jgi:hypothetical protein